MSTSDAHQISAHLHLIPVSHIKSRANTVRVHHSTLVGYLTLIKKHTFTYMYHIPYGSCVSAALFGNVYVSCTHLARSRAQSYIQTLTKQSYVETQGTQTQIQSQKCSQLITTPIKIVYILRAVHPQCKRARALVQPNRVMRLTVVRAHCLREVCTCGWCIYTHTKRLTSPHA